MFYDAFVYLCNKNNISPSAAAVDMGFQKSVVTRWKKGTIPRDANLQKVADYFNVSTDYLLGNETSYETKKSPDQMSEDEEIAQMVEELKNNPGKRLLFSKTSKATKEDIEKIIKMVDILTGGDKSGGSYY